MQRAHFLFFVKCFLSKILFSFILPYINYVTAGLYSFSSCHCPRASFVFRQLPPRQLTIQAQHSHHTSTTYRSPTLLVAAPEKAPTQEETPPKVPAVFQIVSHFSRAPQNSQIPLPQVPTQRESPATSYDDRLLLQTSAAHKSHSRLQAPASSARYQPSIVLTEHFSKQTKKYLPQTASH